MAINRYSAKVWEDTTTNWAADNTVYDYNDLLFDTQLFIFKRGNGVNKYSDLSAIGGSSETPAAWGQITGNITAQTDLQAAMTAKAAQADLSAHAGNTNNPHTVTADQVGLGSVNNTSDANKPVSTATQTALNLKADLASPTFTGTPDAPTATAGTNTTQLATTEFVTAAITASGGGTVLSGTSTQLTFGSVPANSFVDLGFNLTGAAIGDVVSLGIPGDAQVDGAAFIAMVSNTDVIDIRCVNPTGSAINVPQAVYKVKVFK